LTKGGGKKKSGGGRKRAERWGTESARRTCPHSIPGRLTFLKMKKKGTNSKGVRKSGPPRSSSGGEKKTW